MATKVSNNTNNTMANNELSAKIADALAILGAKDIKFSEYQNSIFRFMVENPTKSATINAVAGSGKSFTIKWAAKLMAKLYGYKRWDIAMIAFNKAIVKELNDDMKDFCSCSTSHSVGFGAIAKTYFKRDSNGKYITAIDMPNTMAKYWYNAIRGYICNAMNINADDVDALMVADIHKLHTQARVNLLRSYDSEEIKGLARHFGIELDERGIKVACVQYLLNDSYKVHYIGDLPCIDYVDMLTIPCVDEATKRNLWKYKLAFIDECQDLNLAQRTLLLNVLAKGGRFIAVGDPKQAINGFAGADCDSFSKLTELAKGNELKLSVNYRCGENIVNLAQSIVPQITAHEGAIEGEILNVADLKECNVGDMILCRKSAPLVNVALKFLGKGIKAEILGKDILKGIINTIKHTKAKRIDTMLDYLEKEFAQKEKINRENPDKVSGSQLANFADTINAIQAVCEGIDWRSNSGVQTLIAKLNTLFAKDDDKRNLNCVTLCTAHKSKGLENDKVFILLPDKLPMMWKGQKSWELEQEYNLKYVAITRAKKQLFFVNVDEEKLSDIKVR